MNEREEMKSIDKTKHNFIFSKNVEPVIHCEMGEIVNFQTLDCFSNTLIEEDTKIGCDNPLNSNPVTGPLYIDGIIKGDSIMIEILDIDLDITGIALISRDSKAFSNWDECHVMKRIKIKNSKVNLGEGIDLFVEPMVGTIGVATDKESIASAIPGSHGGNIDCRFVKKGAYICLPAFIDGACLSIGDVHALMGDGELGECGLEIGSNTKIRVSKQIRVIETPYIVYENTVMVIASDEDIYKAINFATQSMIDLIIYYLDIDAEVACHLVNLKGNIGICQICNSLKTVRMEMNINGLVDKIL